MAFDIMNLFEETEDVLTELDEGNELAAVDFANRIFSERPACTATESYVVYQDDAVIRYAQWFLACNKELGIDRCMEGLHRYAGRFWYADTLTFTEDGVATVFQMVDALFSYSQKVLVKHPVDILLVDTQHECLNGETSAVFTAGEMQGCICLYQMQSEEVNPIHVLLHELGHLLHIKATGTLTEIPKSFVGHLLSLGIDCSKLTAAQLQELFADTFMLAVVNKHPELGVPEPNFSAKTLAHCYKYICTLFDSMK